MSRTTTEMQLVPIEKLVPYANNARVHSPEQILKLRSSLREFGFINPVIIDKEFGIIAGHGRVTAAKAEGITDVPCVLVDYLTPAQKKAYIIADNKLAEDASWNEEILRAELEALAEMDFDASLIGFDESELDMLFADLTDVTEDNFDIEAELEKPCVAKAGDIWALGRHKVICGDSTAPATYNELLSGAKVNLVVTDPPYFVNLNSTSGKITNDDLNDADGYSFLKSAFDNFCGAMTNDASIYVFYATAKGRIFHDAFEDAGFKLAAGLVWKKDSLVLSRTDWKFNHEPILYGWKRDGKHIWYGDQKQTTVFEFDRIKNSQTEGFGHPSSKPVALISYLIRLSSKHRDSVLDGFLGSASTLIACEQLNRTCYGIELEPKFVDVAVERFASAVGSHDKIFVQRDGKQFSYNQIFHS